MTALSVNPKNRPETTRGNASTTCSDASGAKPVMFARYLIRAADLAALLFGSSALTNEAMAKSPSVARMALVRKDF